MKERVFYIVNLDRKRISILLLFLFGLLFSFFVLGVSVGKGTAMARIQKANLNTVSSSQTPSVSKSILPSPSTQADEKTATNEVESSDLTLANKAPESKVISLDAPPKLEEDTKKTEELHESEEPVKILRRHTPKKTIVASDPGGMYTIQLAAFSTKQDAENLIRKILLNNPGTKPFLKQSGKFYLVRIGASNDRNQLKKFLEGLKLDANIKKNAILVKNI